MMSSNKKIEELEYLRGIAIAGVVMIHVTTNALTLLDFQHSYLQSTSLVFLILNVLSRFSVPVFLFISGFLFMNKYRDTTFEYTKFLKKRSVELLLPYLGWSIFSLFISFLLNQMSLMMFLKTMFFGKGFFYQLYYIPLLFQMYLLSPFIIKMLKHRRRKVFIVSIIIINIIYLAFFQNEFVHGYLPANVLPIWAKLMQPTFFSQFIYFIVGCMIGMNYEYYKAKVTVFKKPALFYVFITVAMYQFLDFYLSYQQSHDLANSISYFRPSVILFSFVSILFFYQLSRADKWFKPIFLLLGKYSFSIFLNHMFILWIVMIFSDNFYLSVFQTMLTFILTLIGSILFARFTNKWKRVKILKYTTIKGTSHK